jgi:homoserine dehydrogenase
VLDFQSTKTFCRTPTVRPACDAPITVLKFGSSVLRSINHLPRAVDEIYRVLRCGHRVVAVVSAVGDTTDERLKRGRAVATNPEPSALAALLAAGEAESAALLGLALAQVGLKCDVISMEQAGLLASGPVLDAELVGVDVPRLLAELDRCGIAIVPGLAARDESGRPCVLGRGGSDLTALFLADALGASCVLYKDVDGLYDRDPDRPGAQRLASWGTALAVVGGAVQEKALRFAQARGLSFTITAPGAAAVTRIVRPRAPGIPNLIREGACS